MVYLTIEDPFPYKEPKELIEECRRERQNRAKKENKPLSTPEQENINARNNAERIWENIKNEILHGAHIDHITIAQVMDMLNDLDNQPIQKELRNFFAEDAKDKWLMKFPYIEKKGK